MSVTMTPPRGSTCQIMLLEGHSCGKPAEYVVNSDEWKTAMLMCGTHADMTLKQDRATYFVEKGETGVKLWSEVPPTPGIGDNSLKRLSAMAEALQAAKNRVAIIQAQLAKAEAEVTGIESGEMPLLMQELKMKNFELEDGTTVELTEDLKCGITEANKPAAFEWVRKNGWGGIIKTHLTQEFGKGEEKAAKAAAAALTKLTKRKVALKSNIHHSTLKAFIKERLAAGTNISFDLFGIFLSKKVVMTRKDNDNG